ncbi:DUF3077 domain-containing protein [Pseudomonas palleroniana]
MPNDHLFLNKNLGIVGFSKCCKRPNLHWLSLVNTGGLIRDALEHVFQLSHCSKMHRIGRRHGHGADRFAWTAHYLGEMAKAVVDGLANGVTEEVVAV